MGNLVLEKVKNKVVGYQYNELNQLTKKKEGNESYSYTYDKRGNRTAETGKRQAAPTCMTRQTAWRKASTVYDLEGFSAQAGGSDLFFLDKALPFYGMVGGDVIVIGDINHRGPGAVGITSLGGIGIGDGLEFHVQIGQTATFIRKLSE